MWWAQEEQKGSLAKGEMIGLLAPTGQAVIKRGNNYQLELWDTSAGFHFSWIMRELNILSFCDS